MADIFSLPTAEQVIASTTAYSVPLYNGLNGVVGWILGVTVAVGVILFVIRQATRGIRGVTKGRKRMGRRRR